MKRTTCSTKRHKKGEPKWFLVFDGTTHIITTDISNYAEMNVVCIEISAQQAAAYLLMKQTANCTTP
jgi:hypothetical protein